MAEITSEETRRLWNALPEKTWTGLIETLEHWHAPRFREAVVDLLVVRAAELDVAGEDFPEDPEELYVMLNEALEDRAWV